MKVLMFGWEFPPHISGGLGTACSGLTNSLTSFDDIEVTFVLPRVYGNENRPGMKFVDAGEVVLSNRKIERQQRLEKRKKYGFDQQIPAYVTPKRYEEILIKKLKKAGYAKKYPPAGKLEFTEKYGAGLFEEISRYGLVASVIAKNEPHDIIHAHDWLTFQVGIEAKKTSGKPLVVHIHATEYDRCGENQNKTVLDIEEQGMEMADKVITVSEFTRSRVIQKYHISPNKVVTVHNAVEPVNKGKIRNLWTMGVDDKIVTFLGRITAQKGLGYFIEAAYKVLQKMDNVIFVMAGTGDLMEKMIKYAARLRISDKFHFTGFLSGEDVYKMYVMSDLYVMPSVSEPFGISPLEAIQSNVPVIISKQSGVSEVIAHAIKVDFWDIDAMADAIYGILNYPALGSLLRNNSRKEMGKIKWADAAARIREIYNQLVCMKAV
jgi:glycogen(starch) synthase